MDKEQLRQKHPNSSPEEIDALFAQLNPLHPDVIEGNGGKPHPDTSAANAELAKKPRRSSPKKK